MKQLVQSMRHGSVEVLDVPPPQLRGPGVLVRTVASLISTGTERGALDFAKGSLFDKARTRPDLVKQVVQKARREGPVRAVGVALSRLDRPVAPGYACAGTVIATSADLSELPVGTRVACAGAGYATHAEVNQIPKNLTVPIPLRSSGGWVGFDEAAFTTLGAVALHGVRLACPELGDRAVVIGLGPVGLLVLQILRAHGCCVAGVDPKLARCDLARSLGANTVATPRDAPALISSWTNELGADLVIVAAATTGSEPAVLATELARDKGRIVAIGATGLNLPRRTLYNKELSVVVSRSYGPGRYDPQYEEHGHDYPLPYVRWTERENMRAFLDLVADDKVDVRSLISHRFDISDATKAYEALQSADVLGILLEYPRVDLHEDVVPLPTTPAEPRRHSEYGHAAVSLIGAGNFATGVLVPALKRCNAVTLRSVIAATGLSAHSLSEKAGFASCSTSTEDVWNDSECNAAIIATRHDTHASLLIEALDAGKAVFIEKPLCLTEIELSEIVAAVSRHRKLGRTPLVMVGFNRRFAPATQLLGEHFARVQGPVQVIYRINAGRVPRGSWITDSEGGGRILGEVCHFVDLSSYLVGSTVQRVSATRSGAAKDEVMVTMSMANGSMATIAYVVDGDPSTPKERIEVFGGGVTGVIEDFRRASVTSGGRTKRFRGKLSGQDKGHVAEMVAFTDAVAKGAPSPVPFESAVMSTVATFGILRSLESGQTSDIVVPSDL